MLWRGLSDLVHFDPSVEVVIAGGTSQACSALAASKLMLLRTHRAFGTTTLRCSHLNQIVLKFETPKSVVAL